jgi:serine/threonine-protein kinase
MSQGGPFSGSTSSRMLRVQPGAVVAGKFRVDRVLGEGGMGVVVAATHLQLDEPVALKFLLEHAATNPESLARFIREAKAAAKLKSEHVARVIDFGVLEDGTPYIVMEYLQGKDLGAIIRERGPIDPASAAEYVIQAAEGLAEAHARGIVHRDIKPENLFLVDREMGWQEVKILDFGISKIARPAAGGVSANISTQSIMGSPCYMSPEQLRSTSTVDHRTDIWSLGATLFELVSGRTAYDSAKTLPELIAAILESPAAPLLDAIMHVPPGMRSIIARCMEKDRDKRFANTADLAVALLPFAPKRARAAVERAIAVTKSAGMSSSPNVGVGLTLAGDVEAPTLPPPPPPAAVTQQSARPGGASTMQQMAVSTGSNAGSRRSKGAIVGIAAGAVVVAGAIGAAVVLGRGHTAPAGAGTETTKATGLPSVIAPSASAAPPPAADSSSGQTAASPSVAASVEAGSARTGPAASTHHAAPAHVPQAATSSGGAPRPPQDDIRMTR